MCRQVTFRLACEHVSTHITYCSAGIANRKPCANTTKQSIPYPPPSGYTLPKCPLPDCPFEAKNQAWDCCWCGKTWNVGGRCSCVMIGEGGRIGASISAASRVCLPESTSPEELDGRMWWESVGYPVCGCLRDVISHLPQDLDTTQTPGSRIDLVSQTADLDPPPHKRPSLYDVKTHSIHFTSQPFSQHHHRGALLP
ncbi:hypothetical protein NM208_g15779 [Fusarium decemcellulare]|uniref:Uncharacterized protein n=1 Tax=Fusarium decemcellulare TaxID=57161 RepID=A0ACC1RDJ9_9HYPO|nr:hypothetical protein NM208_g15779 [Fusarium decemcellulare]